MIACERGMLDLVKILVKKKCEISVRDKVYLRSLYLSALC